MREPKPPALRPIDVDLQVRLELIPKILTPEELAELRREMQVTLIGSAGGRYVIHYLAGDENIDHVREDGSLIRTLCVRPHEYLYALGEPVECPPSLIFAQQVLGFRFCENDTVARARSFPRVPRVSLPE